MRAYSIDLRGLDTDLTGQFLFVPTWGVENDSVSTWFCITDDHTFSTVRWVATAS